MSSRAAALATTWALVMLALTMAPTASAQRVLEFEAFNAGTDFWFRVGGHPDRNPTVLVEPGETLTVVVRNSGTMPHNLRFGWPVDEASLLIRPGMNATFTFTVPADAQGEFHYWCDPHREYPMQGVWRIQIADEARDAETPLPPAAWVLGVVAVVAALRRVL